jgi:GT2 family glycosyltransferase
MSEEERTGIVTCKLLHTDKKHFDSTGDFYTTRGLPFPRDRNQEDRGQRDREESVFSATGGASLYRCEMLRQIGIFDDYFFAYFEDVDISFRARLAGWHVIYQPKSVCYHAISATSSRLGSFSRYHSIKNLPVLYCKNMPAPLFWKYLPLFLYQLARQLAASTAKGLLFVHLRANASSLGHLPATLRDRRRIQKRRILSSREVDALLVHARPPRIPERHEAETSSGQ